ncbi:MAG: FtsQ-type POTRA domain-containing protein [Bacteroidetes bacterium]|nr:FtsQ-type POTRA domain-containing protein [Bacteroidota bacterium]
MSEPKPKIYLAVFLIVMVVCLAVGANMWKSSLKIDQIKVNGNRIVGTNEIVQLSQIQAGMLLYKADLNEIQQNVKSHFYIKDAVVERNLPSTISIIVTERTPVAMVSLSEPIYLDEDGVMLPKVVAHRVFDLPVISGIAPRESFIYGTVVNEPDEIEALQLLAVLKTVNRPLYHSISEIQLRKGRDMLLYSAEGGVPIIFGRGELSQKISRLEVFWDNIVRTRGVQSLQYVDLRYKDQIIAVWNDEKKGAITM